MKLENSVLTIEQSKHLQELGLDMSDAALYWCSVSHDWKGKEIKDRKWHVVVGNSYQSVGMMRYESIPTYTFQEVLDKLPKRIELKWLYIVNDENKILYAEDYYEDDSDALSCFEGVTLLDAAYNMLCWVIENGYLEEDKK